MKPPYAPYAITRLDGALMFRGYRLGMTPVTSRERSLVILFTILAGVQEHPVYALDDLAVRVFAYCHTAIEMKLNPTQLEVSLTASLVSSKESSNLIATHVEWHTASTVRGAAEVLRNRLAAADNLAWPLEEINLPKQEKPNS